MQVINNFIEAYNWDPEATHMYRLYYNNPYYTFAAYNIVTSM